MEKLSRDQKGSSKGLSFRLDDNLYAVIENYADVTGNNMAEMTRQLLRGALMQLEANQEDRRSVQLVGPPDEKGNPTGLVKIANDRDA